MQGRTATTTRHGEKEAQKGKEISLERTCT